MKALPKRLRRPAAISLIVALAGCGKAPAPDSALAEPAPEAAAQWEAHFTPIPNAGAASMQERLEGAIHPALTAHLHQFIEKHGRLPENFYELANRSVDSVPAVPAGMKFEIDAAERAVRLVRK